MTRTDAKTYIARALSGSSETEQLAHAQDALFAAIQEWNLRHDWSFRLMDTSGGFSVATCTLTGTALTTSATNGFAGVNIGQTATGATIGTVTVTAIVSSTAVTVSGGSDGGPETLTFSADIPIIAGTDTYNLPSPVKRPYSARLVTSNRNLDYKEQRTIDREYTNLSVGGTPYCYNLFNSMAFSTSYQNGKIRVFPVPSDADTLRARFHTPIPEPGGESAVLEVLDRYVYALLELGRYYFLKNSDSENPRTGEYKERGEFLLRKAISDDREGTHDNDMVMVPYIEWGRHRQVDSTQVILDTWW
jgi:hypothetical protein